MINHLINIEITIIISTNKDQSEEININLISVYEQFNISFDFDDKKRVQRVINNAVKKFNKHLKKVAEIAEIDKPLTMHISRHTFGNISGESISLQMLQKLYRHSSITTTINYQANFMHKDVDDALESVIS